jgi:hypothetical protein
MTSRDRLRQQIPCDRSQKKIMTHVICAFLPMVMFANASEVRGKMSRQEPTMNLENLTIKGGSKD